MMNNFNNLAAGMIAFSTFLGVLFAMLYYVYQIRNVVFIEAVLYSEIYILVNVSFLYILKRVLK